MVEDITAYQGIVSQPVEHFDFLGLYKLSRYTNRRQPVVCFGIYNLNILKIHKGIVILCWCGNDCRKMVRNYSLLKRPNIINVTPLPAVRRFMGERGINCRLIKIIAHKRANPLKHGCHIYAYLNRYKPQYHGENIIRSLKLEHDLLIGDFSIPTKDWIAGRMYDFYERCFIGLFLSDFAGGGMGIVEMGLCGIHCVTNVLDLPHCISWKTKDDIEQAIKRESQTIGTTDRELALEVESKLVSDLKGFELNKLCV
jgi:hypothetical protein